jgi:hypothetical protein
LHVTTPGEHPSCRYLTSHHPKLLLFACSRKDLSCFYTNVSKVVLFTTNHIWQDKSMLLKTGHKNHTILCHATTNHAHQTRWLTAQADTCNPALDPRPVPPCVAASSKRDERRVSLLNKDSHLVDFPSDLETGTRLRLKGTGGPYPRCRYPHGPTDGSHWQFLHQCMHLATGCFTPP